MNQLTTHRGRLTGMLLLLWGALGAACSGADGMPALAEEEDIGSTAQAATVAQMQTTMTAYTSSI